MTWNWHSTGKILEEAGCRVLTTKIADDLQHALRESKALSWLADGVNSMLLLTPKGKIAGWFSISGLRTHEPTPDWSMVPRRYHHLRSLLVGRDVICSTTQTGELFLFRKDSVMRWTHEGWRRVSGAGIEGVLTAHVPESAASVLADVAVEMSLRKRGGLIAVVRDPAEISADASPGLSGYFREDPLLQITRADFPLIVRMASLDGCMIVDTTGAIRNAGVILNLPGLHTGAGEGARTAAASFASTHGLAIKISQDGPISVYEHGVLKRFA
jgi:DisA bacterial checkpoint controller nucleotide-binding